MTSNTNKYPNYCDIFDRFLKIRKVRKMNYLKLSTWLKTGSCLGQSSLKKLTNSFSCDVKHKEIFKKFFIWLLYAQLVNES